MRAGWSSYSGFLWLALLLLQQTASCSSAMTSSPTVVMPSTTMSAQEVDESSSTVNTTGTGIPSNNSSFVDGTLPEWRQQLPLELRNKTKTLQRIIVPGPNGCRVEVYLLGTAHVSIDSSRDVRRLLETVDPSDDIVQTCQ